LSEWFCLVFPSFAGLLSTSLKKEAQAKNLVQETYLRAFRFFSNFEPGTNCKVWLLTILRNHTESAQVETRPGAFGFWFGQPQLSARGAVAQKTVSKGPGDRDGIWSYA